MHTSHHMHTEYSVQCTVIAIVENKCRFADTSLNRIKAFALHTMLYHNVPSHRIVRNVLNSKFGISGLVGNRHIIRFICAHVIRDCTYQVSYALYLMLESQSKSTWCNFLPLSLHFSLSLSIFIGNFSLVWLWCISSENGYRINLEFGTCGLWIADGENEMWNEKQRWKSWFLFERKEMQKVFYHISHSIRHICHVYRLHSINIDRCMNWKICLGFSGFSLATVAFWYC